MGEGRNPNRLIEATSPYLLQHAYNPVDWYEWGPEALDRARSEDKPILLSVGYAACHWCHVMAHESFEDEETARLMNEHFVCIKVDREERPDIDAIYMDAVHAMAGQGGWPMTVFLTPEGKPFWAGTYFPKEDRHGLPAFSRILVAITDAWTNRREEVRTQGEKVAAAIARSISPSREPLGEDLLRDAVAGLTRTFDRTWGGFGGAPKFPQPMTLEFLLRMHARGEADALEMATTTLDHMATGGIQDQVGGGFHRYATDGRWLVPHFEKMLYDNAQLALVYLHAWQVTGEARYRRVATDTLDYLLRDMRHAEGGFFSAEDADSEGEEGRFYVWAWDELLEVAGEEAARHFGASPEGNWEGTNILWTGHGGAGTEQERVDAARASLLERRSKRVRPAVDDKILAGWNGLAIRALAEAGAALAEPRYLTAAEEAAGFVLTALRPEDGRVRRAWREGRTSGPGYADDYAQLAAGCLALWESTFDLRWFVEARRLADDLIRLFHDPDDGGFYQSGSDAETLVARPKELFDNAVPSAGSVAAEVLQRLTLMTGEVEYERAGVSALRLVQDAMGKAPTGFGHALSAVDLYLSRAKEIALSGDPGGEPVRTLAAAVWQRYLPNAVLAAGHPDDAETVEAVPLLRDRPLVNGGAAAYVCERFVCQRPVSEPDELARQLA